MNILVLGGGGREHALAWAVKQNPKCDRLIVAPGNAGIAELAECADLDILDGGAVVDLRRGERHRFRRRRPRGAAGRRGRRRAARRRHAVLRPLGRGGAAGGLESVHQGGLRRLRRAHRRLGAVHRRRRRRGTTSAAQGAPIVVKADGLAAGKGVIVAMTEAEALAAVDEMFGGAFGAAGAEVVIEEFMAGEEASFFVLCDGETVLPIGTAQDHKRVGEGDTGPNTGGMGAYSPAPVLTDAIAERALAEIIRPTVAEMARRGTPFRGVLYAGLMIDGRRAAAGRIQRPLRRSRMPGADDAARRAGARPAAGLRRGPAGRGPGPLGRRSRADRGDGGARLSRRLRQGQRRSAGWTRCPRTLAHDLPRRHRRARRPTSSPAAAAC